MAASNQYGGGNPGRGVHRFGNQYTGTGQSVPVPIADVAGPGGKS